MFDFEKQEPRSREQALHLVFQEGQPVIQLRGTTQCLFTYEELHGADWRVHRELFLGHWQGRPCFAHEIAPDATLDVMQHYRGNLYELLGRTDDALFALAGRAAQLLAWERDHRYCGRCGSEMVMDGSERAMRCAECTMVSYPRISPCIIVLVLRGEELLLARHARYRKPMYSTLAGFIEAGESAEHCLQREVREEVGVEVENPRYFGSQAWPFPGQLMLGYFADHSGGDIRCDDHEIVEADWYHFSHLPNVPPTTSIAGQLIQHAVAELSAERRPA
jgi:NAD+ diphosphatase